MTLTVPRAGVVAGRAPQIQVEAPTTGADIAEFGQAMQRVGIGLERERNGRLLAQAKTGMMAGLNDLRLELENSGDPDLIDTGFPQRATALRDQLLSDLPQSIRADAQIAFDDMAERNRFSLGRVAMELRHGQRRVALQDMQRTVVSGAAGADADLRAGLMEQFVQTVEENLQAGALNPEQAAKLIADTDASINTAEARRLLRDDPDALAQRLETGDIFGLDEEARQSWLTRARAEIDNRADALARAAERDQRQREQEVGAELAEATRILKSGRMPENLDALTGSEMHLAHANAEAFGQALMLYERRPDFLRAPPDIMRQMIAEEEARPISSAGENDILSTMRAALVEAEQAWTDDPITASVTKQLGNPPSLPDDPASTPPGALAEALLQRSFYSESLLGNDDLPGYLRSRDDLRLFSNEERALFKQMADPSAPPSQRADLATAFALAFGDDAPEWLTEISTDPVFDFVGGMVAAGGDPRLARSIFEGQRAIDNQDVPLPARPQRRQAWFVEFQGLFDNEFETGMRDAVIAAADALYAYRARGDASRTDGRISETAYMQAVHEVLGGTGEHGRRSARGGVQQINGHATLLPPHVAGREVERAWNAVGRELAFGNLNVADLGDLDAETDRIMRSLSATGSVPVFGGQVMDANTWANTGLRAIGDGRYALIYTHPTLGQTIAHDDQGQIFQLDLQALLERGRR